MVLFSTFSDLISFASLLNVEVGIGRLAYSYFESGKPTLLDPAVLFFELVEILALDTLSWHTDETRGLHSQEIRGANAFGLLSISPLHDFAYGCSQGQ